MDFMNQNNRQQPTQRPSGLGGSTNKPSISNEEDERIETDVEKKGNPVKKHIDRISATKIPFLFLAVTISVLSIALIFKIMNTNTQDSASLATVDTTKYQAVFLNNNQVYFGKVKAASSKDLSLEDIYYIQVNGQNGATTAAQPQNITLVKLGCEIHGPQDKMVINRDQILFWENLKDDGQVVQKIKENQSKGPQNCNAQTGSSNTQSQQNTTNQTQQAQTTPTPATSTQTTTTPTPATSTPTQTTNP